MSIPTFSGSAIPILSVPPDWSDTVELSMRYPSNIAEALSLLEERQSLSPRPLYGLRFASLTRAAKEVGYLKTIVELAQDLPVGVPLWPLAAKLTAAASAGATSLSVDDTTGCLFDVFTQYALVWQSFDVWEVVELSGVTQFGATLSAATANAYTTTAFLLPLAYGSLKREGATGLTDTAAKWKCRFEETFHGLHAQGTPEDTPASAPSPPASPPTLALWLKADFASLTDGAAIGDGTNNWTDSSGNGHTCSQSTSGKRPVWKGGIAPLSMPGILFTAASLQCLNFDGISRTTNSDFTFIAVFQKTSVGAGCIMGTGSGSPAVLDVPASDDFASSETARMLAVVRYRNADVNPTSYRENKVARGSVAGGGTAVTWNQIGASEIQPEGFHFNGYLFEVCLWTGALTDAQLDDLYDNYFKPRWTLP